MLPCPCRAILFSFFSPSYSSSPISQVIFQFSLHTNSHLYSFIYLCVYSFGETQRNAYMLVAQDWLYLRTWRWARLRSSQPTSFLKPLQLSIFCAKGTTKPNCLTSKNPMSFILLRVKSLGRFFFQLFLNCCCCCLWSPILFFGELNMPI